MHILILITSTKKTHGKQGNQCQQGEIQDQINLHLESGKQHQESGKQHSQHEMVINKIKVWINNIKICINNIKIII